MQLRDYQINLIKQTAETLRLHGIVYLTLETRVGKTPVSLCAAQKHCESHTSGEIIFLTKKSVIPSIMATLEQLGAEVYNPVTVMSFDSLHKLTYNKNAIYIIDEAHSFGSFPKPSLRAKNLRKLTKGCPVILLSATPSPESYSMLFHQFWACNSSLWTHKNFYAWAQEYVDIRKKRINAIQYVNDYKTAKNDLIKPFLDSIMISFSKADAGFAHTDVEEIIVECEPSDLVKELCHALKEKRIVCWKSYTITGDTAAGLMSKLHQLYSGTVIPDCHETGVEVSGHKLPALQKIIDQYRKVAVFYKFIAEREMLKKYLGDRVTENAEEFEASDDKVFIGQYLSKREGIDLKSAAVTVFFTLDYAYLSYEQAKNRMQSYSREQKPVLIVLMTKGSLDSRIWKLVKAKRNFTTSYFERMI